MANGPTRALDMVIPQQGQPLAVSSTPIPVPMYAISGGVALVEGNSGPTVFTFTITRIGLNNPPATVPWSVAGYGANPAAAADFVGSVLPSGNAVFLQNQLQATIAVAVQGDTSFEPNEDFIVSLGQPSDGGTLGVSVSTGTILNDDSVPVTPANTVAPIISTAVIGTPMSVTSFGTWTNSPTSFAVNWKVGAVSKGANYTPVEADRTLNITAEVTATNANGPSAATPSAASVCRRTEPSIAYNFGQSTPARAGTLHYGKVQLKYLLASSGRYSLPVFTGSGAFTSWTIDNGGTGNASNGVAAVNGVISGTPTHWDWTVNDGTAGGAYTPCIATAIAGSYAFRTKLTFSDGVVEYVDLYITAKANTMNISDYDFGNYDFVFRSGSNKLPDFAGGRMEFSVGTWFDSTAVNGMRLQSARPTNRIVFTNSDDTRPAHAPGYWFDSCANIDFLNLRTADGPGYGNSLARIQFSGGVSPFRCDGCNLIGYEHLNANSVYATTGGAGFGGSEINAVALGAVDTMTISGLRVRYVSNGIISVNATNVNIYAPEIDQYFDNGILIGGDSNGNGSVVNGINIYDPIITRPMAGIVGQHKDPIQLQDAANGGYLKVFRAVIAQAGGSGQSQGFFSGISGSTTAQQIPIDCSLNGLLGGSADPNGLILSRGNNSTVQNVAMTKSQLAAGSPDSVAGTGPDFNGDAGINACYTGTNVIKDSFFLGSKTFGKYTDGGNVVAYNGAENAAHFYSGQTPRAYLAAISEATWLAMTPAQIKAAYKAAFRPAVGSPLDGHGPIDAATGDWRASVLAAV